MSEDRDRVHAVNDDLTARHDRLFENNGRMRRELGDLKAEVENLKQTIATNTSEIEAFLREKKYMEERIAELDTAKKDVELKFVAYESKSSEEGAMLKAELGKTQTDLASLQQELDKVNSIIRSKVYIYIYLFVCLCVSFSPGLYFVSCSFNYLRSSPHAYDIN